LMSFLARLDVAGPPVALLRAERRVRQLAHDPGSDL